VAVLAPYRRVLSKPGAWQFSAAGVLARLPLSMVAISIVLMVTSLYDSYALAGRVSAVYAVSQALCAPQLAKLVDWFGQSRVMRKSLAVALTALVVLAVAGWQRAPEAVLYVTAALGGAMAGSMGSMVRARWTRILSEPREIHTAFSLESALDELVFVVGPVMATFLATSVHPVGGLLVAVAASGIGGFWLLSQRATEPAASGRPDRGGRRSVIRRGGMITVVLVFISVGVIFGGLDVATIAFVEERGVRSFAGVLLGVLACGSLLSGLAYGARNFVSPLWKRFVVGMLLLAGGVSVFLLIDTVPVLAVVMFVVGLAISPTIITGNALVQSMVPANRLTEGLAWASTSIGVGFASGMSMTGEVIERAGADAGYVVMVAAGWVGVLIALLGARVLRAQAQAARTSSSVD